MRECGLKLVACQCSSIEIRSLPVRECGLKPKCTNSKLTSVPVTPRAGVWIETCGAPLLHRLSQSLPVRECGLKPPRGEPARVTRLVTPRAGVWIETYNPNIQQQEQNSHSPCGSVD